jgi:hypothetical protein
MQIILKIIFIILFSFLSFLLLIFYGQGNLVQLNTKFYQKNDQNEELTIGNAKAKATTMATNNFWEQKKVQIKII